MMRSSLFLAFVTLAVFLGLLLGAKIEKRNQEHWDCLNDIGTLDLEKCRELQSQFQP